MTLSEADFWAYSGKMRVKMWRECFFELEMSLSKIIDLPIFLESMLETRFMIKRAVEDSVNHGIVEATGET
jgi:hypothetical protein